MKKIILAALLALSCSAQATEFYTDTLAKRITDAGNTDMLYAYKQGLERAKAKKEAAEIEVKIAELQVAVSKMEQQVIILTNAVEEMEKNK